MLSFLSHYKKVKPIIVQQALKIYLQYNDAYGIHQILTLYKEDITIAVLN